MTPPQPASLPDDKKMKRITLRRVPNKHYSTGEGVWAFGTPTRYDSWDHSPSHWMQGPCPQCGSPTSTYGGSWSCHSDHCCNNSGNFACSAGPRPEWWETQVNVFKDGNAWCATEDGFVNLQESVAGFGDTPQKAYEDLVKNSQSEAPKETPVPVVSSVPGIQAEYEQLAREHANATDALIGSPAPSKPAVAEETIAELPEWFDDIPTDNESTPQTDDDERCVLATSSRIFEKMTDHARHMERRVSVLANILRAIQRSKDKA